jgi:ribosomal protein L22
LNKKAIQFKLARNIFSNIRGKSSDKYQVFDEVHEKKRSKFRKETVQKRGHKQMKEIIFVIPSM